MHEKILQRRFANLKNDERKMMEEHGWVAHFVFDTDGSLNGMSNYHTHGLKESFGHMDLQAVLPTDPKNVHSIFAGIVDDIKKGRVFQPEVRTPDVIQNFDVYFRVYREGNRDALRMFLPDPKGRFPFDEGCDPVYKKQADKIGD